MKKLRFLIGLLILTLTILTYSSDPMPVSANQSPIPNPVIVYETTVHDEASILGPGWCYSAYGNWSSWQYLYGSGTRYFSPSKVGNHCIDVQGTNGDWGKVDLYWRNGNGTWNYFHSMNVDSVQRRALLSSGSNSINYKFVFVEGAGAGDARFRTFTD